MITCDAKASPELTRRLGEAQRIFKQLAKIWGHTSVGWQQKYRVYESCVLGKLLYSLDSIWLLSADRNRLDVFHCRCLRRLLGIPHSYISRVTNADVLNRAHAEPLSQMLLDRQINLYDKIVASDSNSLVKQIVCHPDGTPKTWVERRRRGRPRQQWAQEVHKMTQRQ